MFRDFECTTHPTPKYKKFVDLKTKTRSKSTVRPINRSGRTSLTRLYMGVSSKGAKDLLDKKEFDVEYCSTEAMQADFMTKPLQGELFEKQMKWLMGIE